MKKIIFIFLLLIPLKTIAITASSYIVMDSDSGRILESKNENKQYLIASTTKILTAVTAIEYGNLDDKVKIGEEITSSYGSGIYVTIGEELTLDDLLYGLMLRSGNDASLAIAKHVADTIPNFVFLMNEEAKKIGMNNSIFLNPSGLEERNGEGNKSTVEDMAKLMQYANKLSDFKRITSTKEITIKSSLKTYKWTNKNKLLRNYIYCTGGKTGYTQKAHRTLVTSATKNNMNLIVVTFNDGNDFQDHEYLYEKYFNNYKIMKVIDKNTNYVQNTIIKNDFNLIINEDDIVSTNIIKTNQSDPLNGSVVGKIEVILNNKVIGYRNLYYQKEDITKNKSFLNKLKEILKL